MINLNKTSWSMCESAEIINLLVKIAKAVYSTDSYWDCDVKSTYMEIEKLIKENIEPMNVSEEDEHE